MIEQQILEQLQQQTRLQQAQLSELAQIKAELVNERMRREQERNANQTSFGILPERKSFDFDSKDDITKKKRALVST
jgi:DNA invertase Pin-like site-specific DNA recombinase